MAHLVRRCEARNKSGVSRKNHEMSLLNTLLKVVGPLIPDSLAGRGAREYFNHHYQSFGVMTTLHIDSTNKRASLDLELKGEAQPLQVTIGCYELSSMGGKTFIEIKEFNTSREWINFLARDFLKGKKFEVPELLGAVL